MCRQPNAQRHIAWDIGIAEVTERLSERLDATAVLQVYSRLVIGLQPRSVLAERDAGGQRTDPDPRHFGLSPEARAARVAAVFTPYHDRIRALLDAREGRRTVLVAMHSFTPSFKGENRAMHVGMLYNKDARLAEILLDLLRREGDLVVGDNAPYADTEGQRLRHFRPMARSAGWRMSRSRSART